MRSTEEIGRTWEDGREFGQNEQNEVTALGVLLIVAGASIFWLLVGLSPAGAFTKESGRYG